MKKLIMIVLLCLVPVLQWSSPTLGTTYYVDFAGGADSNNGTAKANPWKYAPGMAACTANCAAYSHSAGDQFIFKGGVTWDNTVAPWTNAYSGAAGNPDYYGVDATWYTGGSWTHPVFDGGSIASIPLSYKLGYFKFTGSYLTFDSLQVQNIGIAGTNQDNYALSFTGHDLLIENMVLPVQSRIAILVTEGSGTTVSNFTFSGNTISKCSWGIAIAVNTSNTIVDNVTINGNTFRDFHDQIANGKHADGIFLYGPSASGTDPSFYINAPTIYDNQFYGDWSASDIGSGAGVTALIGLFYNVNGPRRVYTNVAAISAATGGYFYSGGNIAGVPDSSVYIYNNSAFVPSTWQGFAGGGFPSYITNNIFSGGSNGFPVLTTDSYNGLHVTNNDFYNQPAGGCWIHEPAGCKTYAQFVAQGFNANGFNQDPVFTSSSNLALQPTSPAIGAGVDLSATFTTDITGATYTVPWPMGAYKFTAGGPALVNLTPLSVSVSNVAPGSPQSIRLLNSGGSSLTISSITVSGGWAFVAGGSTCGASLSSLASCTVTVAPVATGAPSGSVTFTTSAGSSPDVVLLSSSGIFAPFAYGEGSVH
jgi:hypothetical protein